VDNTLHTTLEVGPDVAWFRRADGPPVDLVRRNTLRRTLRALLQERERQPAIAPSQRELFESIWPGEDFHPHVASNRLRVNVWWLRRLGLGDAVKTRGSNYLIDESVPLKLH